MSSFFRGFFGAIGAVFGLIFAIWLLKITFIPHAHVHFGHKAKSKSRVNFSTRKKWSCPSKPFNSNTQDIKNSSSNLFGSSVFKKEHTWTFDTKDFDTLSAKIGNGRVWITGDDTVEDITVKVRIEASSESHDSTQKLLDQTNIIADKDLKNNKIELSFEQPRSITNANIDWIIVCPQDIALVLEAQNGHVIMENMESNVHIRANNGQIDVTTPHVRKPVSYQANNGKISLELGQLEEDAFVSAETKNGAIFVNLPNNSAYKIATKVNLGIVMSSYPTSDTVDENTQIALETKNGMIYIR